MAVKRRGDHYYIYFRPFGKQIGVKTDLRTKQEAEVLQSVLLKTLRTGRYECLEPDAREIVIRLFENRGWEVPTSITRIARPKDTFTLWDACQLFKKYPGIKDYSGLWRYGVCLSHVTAHLGKDMELNLIGVPDLRKYQTNRLAEGAAPGTINRELSSLSKLFGVMMEMQLISVNPCLLVKRLSEKSGERKVYISSDDFSRIRETLPGWMQRVAMVGYYSAMRRGEIVGLTWDAVDLPNRIITLKPEQTKEFEWKSIPLREELIGVFQEAGKVRSLDADVVFRCDGRPICPSSLTHAWGKAVRRLGYTPPPRFHDLRATWKTNARRSGMDSEIRKSIMGHSTRARDVDERYGDISESELVKAIDTMSFEHGQTRIRVASK